MKKTNLFVVSLVTFTILLPSASLFAQLSTTDSKKNPTAPAGVQGKDATSRKKLPGMGAMMPLGGSMEGMMMASLMRDKSVTPTSDGGIVIVIGNQVTKYDKDLKVVKETELKVDFEKLRQYLMEIANTGRQNNQMPRPEDIAQLPGMPAPQSQS